MATVKVNRLVSIYRIETKSEGCTANSQLAIAGGHN